MSAPVAFRPTELAISTMCRLFFPARFACLAGLILVVFCEELRAQQGAPEQAAGQALELFNSGQYKEAAEAYAAIIKNYPTSPVVPEAQFRLGYLNFVLGDFDKSIEALKKTLAPPAPPEIQELGYALLPQAIAAKATKMKPEDRKRAPAFEDAIKNFDLFLQKYPGSDQAETANYGRALASYQIQKYDDAVKSLRENLTKFARSETILDSQYLLALTLATQANVALRENSDANRAGALAKFDEAVKLLRDIVQKRVDVALANDARFQIGEVLFSRAALEDQTARPKLYDEAVAAYRAVQPKEAMIKAQEARLANIVDRLRAALGERKMADYKRLQRLQEHAGMKLQTIRGRAEQTVMAQIKVAACFYLQQRYDEARVLLRHVQQFAEEDEQKKQILYYLAMSYAAQRIADKAVTSYNEFQAKFKGDPMADNLPLAIGTLFLSPDPKVNDPQKAQKYFKDALSIYPKGRFVNETLTQQAAALVQLKRYDQAHDAFKKFLATNPKKEFVAAAEFGIATVTKETGKLDDAISQFKAVREKYPGTQQAEEATFWIGQLLVHKGDAKGALGELRRHLAANPEGQLAPAAMFAIAQAQAQIGDKIGAQRAFEEIAQKFPRSDAAQFAFFQRAALFAKDNKVEEMIATMRTFIDAYPGSDKIFFAYDSIGQTQINAGKLGDAIATYTQMAEKHPDNPQAPQALYQAADLWRRYATETQGRYLGLSEQQRTEWNRGIAGSIEAAEKLVVKYPDSRRVALALQTLLEDQRLLVNAKLKTADEVETYFQNFAAKFAEKPTTKSKILFTLAAFIFERDKAKALAQMQSAFDLKLTYSPENIDLFGSALIEHGKTNEALKVYQKLAADFPNPPDVAPDKASPAIQEAQASALYGIGRALQKQGKVAEAAQQFDTLKKLYPWSPKILEANYGIAQSLTQEGKLDDAMTLLSGIIRAPSATAELRANSMLLGGQIQEKKGALEPAIDYYIKIATFYEGVPPAAAEGLWRGGQLLEKQAATLPESSNDKNKPTKPGQLAKAVRAYKDLVEKYPGSEFAVKAKERLEALPAPNSA